MRSTMKCLCVAVVLTGMVGGAAPADEGMWLFNNPPTAQLKAKFGFEPTSDWLDHLQKSCVKFGFGGSASLVSPNGLVMTNHHVGRGQLQRLSTKERDLLADGFLARTPGEELKCPDAEVNVLWTIEDVTDSVKSAVTTGMSPADANKARKKRIADITKSAEDSTGLNCSVVTLYHGARYHLYSYKRYTDLRLVMAPEGKIAHFGGDTDNFEYPRFCLDMCFFRIYEDGKPLKSEDHLTWSANGVKDGALIFVAGNPGSTQRQYTVDHLKYQRDVAYPNTLESIWRREVQLINFSARSAENARIAESNLMGIQNGRKAITGMLSGLHDPEVLRKKTAEEQKLRAAVGANPDYSGQWGGAWDAITRAKQAHRDLAKELNLLAGRGSGGGSRLFGIARTLVRMADELPKPNGDRLPEFRDSSLDSMKLQLFSPAPIYDSLEIDSLASGFSYLAEQLGGDDPLVTSVLSGKSPRARAIELVEGTKLSDPAERRRLADGGKSAIDASSDPLIRLAYDLDPQARAVRKRYEDEVQGVEAEAYEKIGAARFAVYGEDIPPDATGTLRLTYGTVSGFSEGSSTIPPMTNFAGLFERWEERKGNDAFALSDAWLHGKDKLELSTPFNFVCTADVVGGNSGSPVVNAKGEVVGLVFDGNIHTLVWNTAFTDRVARTVAVDSRGIVESLRKIYGATALADEIQGR